MEPSHAVAPPTTGAYNATPGPTVASPDPLKVNGRRFGAYLIDALLLGALVPVLIFFAVSRPTIYTDSPSCEFLEVRELVPSGEKCFEVSGPDEGTWVLPTTGYIAAGLYLVIYLIAIEWILQATTGMTIGKLLFGIRTVDESGTGPGIGKQLLRGVVWIIDSITLILPIAAWSILATKRNQRLGDLAAGTFVVRSAARGIPVPGPATGGAAPAPGLDPSGMVPGAFPSAPPTDATAYPPNAPVVAPVPASMAPPEDLTSVYVPAAEPTTIQPAVTGPTDGDPTIAEGAPAAAPVQPESPQPESPQPESPQPETAQTAVGATTGDPGGPQWDPARNAYIQWDAPRGTWLVYDEAAAEWKPIS